MNPYIGEPLKIGDRVRFLRTVSKYARKGEVHKVATVVGGPELEGGFRLYGPEAVTQYREGKTWVRLT